MNETTWFFKIFPKDQIGPLILLIGAMYLGWNSIQSDFDRVQEDIKEFRSEVHEDIKEFRSEVRSDIQHINDRIDTHLESVRHAKVVQHDPLGSK